MGVSFYPVLRKRDSTGTHHVAISLRGSLQHCHVCGPWTIEVFLHGAGGHGRVPDVEVVPLRVDGLKMDGAEGMHGCHGERT